LPRRSISLDAEVPGTDAPKFPKARGPKESPQVEATFELPGPLGVSWMQHKDAKLREVAVVKAVKPGSPAGRVNGLTPGLVLGWVNDEWCKGGDYFELINTVREERPLKLGFCDQLNAPVEPSSTAVAAVPANYSVPKKEKNYSLTKPREVEELPPAPAVSPPQDTPIPDSPSRMVDTIEEGEEAGDSPEKAPLAAKLAAGSSPVKLIPAEAKPEPRAMTKPGTMKKAGAAGARGGARATSVAVGARDVAALLLKPAAKAAPREQGQKKAPEFTAKFSSSGPVGIVWGQATDDQGREVAVVKALRGGSPASEQSAMLPGFMRGAVLGYINGVWVKGLDYFDTIKQIQSTRPLELGYVGRIEMSSNTTPRADAGRKSPEHQARPVACRPRLPPGWLCADSLPIGALHRLPQNRRLPPPPPPAEGGTLRRWQFGPPSDPTKAARLTGPNKALEAPAPKVAPRRLRAQSVAVDAAPAASASLEQQMAAAIIAADDPDGKGHPDWEDPEVEAAFAEAGPLGIVWSQILDGQTLDYACAHARARTSTSAVTSPD
jgi:hypothetical protein